MPPPPLDSPQVMAPRTDADASLLVARPVVAPCAGTLGSATEGLPRPVADAGEPRSVRQHRLFLSPWTCLFSALCFDTQSSVASKLRTRLAAYFRSRVKRMRQAICSVTPCRWLVDFPGPSAWGSLRALLEFQRRSCPALWRRSGRIFCFRATSVAVALPPCLVFVVLQRLEASRLRFSCLFSPRPLLVSHVCN